MNDDSKDSLKDGVLIVTLTSWPEFHKQVLSLKSKRGYVWRGQKKDEDSCWFLESKFDRNVHSKDQHERAQKLKRHLNNFKKKMNETFPNVLPQNVLDIWALGQHYGLMTPLLDWTLSPYIAAYFAFNERVDQNDQTDNYRYIYALNRSIERLISKQKKSGRILSSGRSVPFIDQLPYPNPRFTAQKGIFTKAFQGDDIWKYVQGFSRKRPSEVIIVKFRIPTRDREECLRELHLMNIDHISLLLDLSSVVDRCNNKLYNRH
jgi:hypothetical protein